MSSGADLFVVCKQCGSEVSPYITECPYCGHRLRRRAPKLPRPEGPGRSSRGRRRARDWRIVGRGRARPADEPRARAYGGGRWADSRPYATIALVAASCAVWVAWRGGFVGLEKLVIFGPLNGDWWKLFTSQFTYVNGFYEFVTLVAIAIFGWLLERRHGPAVALALFLGAGVTGALVASAVYSYAFLSGCQRGRSRSVGGVGDPRPSGCARRPGLRRRSAGHGCDRRRAAGDAVRAAGNELAGGGDGRGVRLGVRAQSEPRAAA